MPVTTRSNSSRELTSSATSRDWSAATPSTSTAATTDTLATSSTAESEHTTAGAERRTRAQQTAAVAAAATAAAATAAIAATAAAAEPRLRAQPAAAAAAALTGPELRSRTQPAAAATAAATRSRSQAAASSVNMMTSTAATAQGNPATAAARSTVAAAAATAAAAHAAAATTAAVASSPAARATHPPGSARTVRNNTERDYNPAYGGDYNTPPFGRERRAPRSTRSSKRAEAEARYQLAVQMAEEAKARTEVMKAQLELAALDSEEEELDEELELEKSTHVEQWVETTRRRLPPPEPEPPLEQLQPKTEIQQLTEAILQATRINPPAYAHHDLPTFNGNLEDWLGFNRLYEETEGYLTPAQNMGRLRKAIQGTARDTVKSLLLIATNPREVISVLERRYGRPDAIVLAEIEKIKKHAPLTDAPRDTCIFASRINNMVATIKALEKPYYLHSPELCKAIIEKLTPIGRYRWYDHRARSSEEEPEVVKINHFLSMEADLCGAYAPPETEKQRYPSKNAVATRHVNTAREEPEDMEEQEVVVATVNEKPKKYCVICTGEHWVTECKKFTEANPEEKWKMAMDHKLCFRCLRRRHQRSSCRSPPCKKCKKGHHTLLHAPKHDSYEKKEEVKQQDEKINSIVCAVKTKGIMATYLKIVPVELYGDKGSKGILALLDEGSTLTLLDETVAREIGMEGKKELLNIKTVGGGRMASSSLRADLRIRGLHRRDKRAIMNVRTMENLKLPPRYLNAEDLEACEHLEKIKKEIVYEPEEPKMIIGQDNWNLIVSRKIIKGKSTQPVASLTSLGWVLHGAQTGISAPVNFVNHCTEESNIEKMIREQFSIDAMGVEPKLPSNDLEKKATSLLEATTRRLPDGRFESSLLLKEEKSTLPNNFSQALKRLKNVKKKLEHDDTLKREYEKQMQHLLDCNYAEEAPAVSTDNQKTFYLPHFAVVHPTKKKIRIVFDAAARHAGRSLNDALLQGPDQLQSLYGVLLRFRERPIAVIADIKEMFLQIKIREEDRDSLRFLWSKEKEEVKEYRMTSVIFGAKSSPAIAIFTKNKNAQDHAEEYPEASRAIVRNHYMDDYLQSFASIEEAQKTTREVDFIHKQAGFQLRGWASNDRRALKEVREEDNLSEVALTHGNHEKTLGMLWLTEEDALAFNVSLRNLPIEVASGEKMPTKRQVTSAIMSTFDPIGLVAPVLIQGKKIVQQLWKKGISWDEAIGEDMLPKWKNYLDQIKALEKLKIPRSITKRTTEGELHVFVDASEESYVAIAYWRSTEEDGSIRVSPLAAKAKVAPTKPISMPRLELQAALLGSRLARSIIDETDLCIMRKTFWSDSSTVLRWIKASPRQFKTFVAHRLAEIEEHTRQNEWRWVPTKQNPADDATRGVPEDFNAQARWFTGPSFLHLHEDSWPENKFNEKKEEITGEERSETVATIQRSSTTTPDEERFSSWTKLQRTTARILMFVDMCKKKLIATTKSDSSYASQQKKRKTIVRNVKPEVKLIPISADYLDKASDLLIKKAQKDSFTKEMEALRKMKPLEKISKLKKFDVGLEDDGIIRLRGRIEKVSGVGDETKKPAILDARHRITRLIVADFHQRCYHGNHATVMNEIRQRYYVLGLRSLVRKLAKDCQWCKVRRARPQNQPAGSLPVERLQHHKRPFTHTAVDYFGPMKVKIGRRLEKRWGVLFTCMTTRAVHLELAPSLTTSSMIMALRRMAARRGMPSTIHSDNGTNFVGADRELREEIGKLKNDLPLEANKKGIQWKFIPPGAPNMGGAWERMVKSVKTALNATLNEKTPSEETLHTLLAEIEHTVNSRPLTDVSTDPEEEEGPTPNHFLLGQSNGAPAIVNFDATRLTKEDWRSTQLMADHFWRRWIKEYLPTLLPRPMNKGEVASISIGDIVIIVDNTLPRNVWPRDEVVRRYEGPDGRTRVVDVRTAGGILKRPVSRLVVVVPAASRPRDGV